MVCGSSATPYRRGSMLPDYEIRLLRDETAALVDDKAATDIRLGKCPE